MPHADQMLTAAEVADRLGVKASTVMKWSWAGKIPSRKLSAKVVRFDYSAVVTALESADRKAVAQ